MVGHQLLLQSPQAGQQGILLEIDRPLSHLFMQSPLKPSKLLDTLTQLVAMNYSLYKEVSLP